jgi:hypothetical protein
MMNQIDAQMERLHRIDTSLAARLAAAMQDNKRLTEELAAMITRVEDLLKSNNEFEARARRAEVEVSKWKSIAHRMLEMVEQTPEESEL